jgi:hypothetical protein
LAPNGALYPGIRPGDLGLGGVSHSVLGLSGIVHFIPYCLNCTCNRAMEKEVNQKGKQQHILLNIYE